MDRKSLFLWMIILTALAGLINALAICYFGTTVSHVTGLVSNVSISISKGNWSNMWWLLSVILSFLVGAIAAGIITAERKFYLNITYGIVILSIGVILALGVFILKDSTKNLVRLFALLMGLQNGMVVSFRGVVVRMTHMSGNLTDLGVFIGYKIRRKSKEDYIMGIIPFTALIIFIIGGVAGMGLYHLMKINAYYVAALTYLVLGGVYFILQRTCKDRDFNGIDDELEKAMDEVNE